MELWEESWELSKSFVGLKEMLLLSWENFFEWLAFTASSDMRVGNVGKEGWVEEEIVGGLEADL